MQKRYLESLSPALLVVAFVATSFLAFICFRWDAPVGVSFKYTKEGEEEEVREEERE